MSKITINKEKSRYNDNNSNFKSITKLSNSSLFEDINFSSIFNPNNKYINSGEKTSFDLISFELGIFDSLSNICKNLNISYEKIYSNYSSSKNNNENTTNSANNKDNFLTDSILNILLNESSSEKKNINNKESSIKKSNNSGISLNEDDLNELLKDYSPMELEK